jgi:SNF2 family DNA or RNA helicase
MSRALFPQQHEALRYAQSRRRIALFMEMRLGKTKVAIHWAKHHRCGRVLVLAPLSVLPGWVEELEKEDIRSTDIFFLEGPVRDRIALAREIDEGWALCNYEAITHNPDLLSLPWSAIILDESSHIRNPRAKITKYLLTRTAHISLRAILSGLPAPEGCVDYYCQMAFLYGQFMSRYNFWAFRDRHFYPDVKGWHWEPKSGTLDAIKKEIHRLGFVMTRKAAGLGEKKIYERRYVRMNSDQQRLYNQVMQKFAYKELKTKWVVTQYVWAARLAGGFSPDQEHPDLISNSKAEEILSLLLTELKNEPVVIWFRFNEELHHVASRLDDAEISYRKITGETSNADRRAYQQFFQEGQTQVMLMQVKCGKFGLNLSRASTAIYYSNDYDLESRAQSEDRIVHPTKHEPLLYIDLITRNTVDTAVIETLKQKGISSRTFMSHLIENIKKDYAIVYGGNKVFVRAAMLATTPLKTRIRRVYPGENE